MTQVQKIFTDSRIYSRPVAYLHDINIDEPFVEVSDWRSEIDVIRNAGQGDVINLHIEGPGGSVSVASALIKAMEESQAHIVGHLSGMCASAHTLVFLSCHEFVVGDDAEMMIHSSSSGYRGKETEFYQYAQHYNKTNSKMMKKYYKNFLSSEEIANCVNGLDFWMDAEEVITRLEARRDAAEEQALDSLSRSELEDVASQVGIKFTKKTSDTKLRACIKEKVDGANN